MGWLGSLTPPSGILHGTVKILLADDDRLVRTIVSDLLGELGHDVVQAENGQQAVELSESSKPDLLILDFLMPKLSGIDQRGFIFF